MFVEQSLKIFNLVLTAQNVINFYADKPNVIIFAYYSVAVLS